MQPHDGAVRTSAEPVARRRWVEPKWQTEMFVRWLVGDGPGRGWQFQKDLEVLYGHFVEKYGLFPHSWVAIGRELGRICKRKTVADPANPGKRVKMYNVTPATKSEAYVGALRSAGFEV